MGIYRINGLVSVNARLLCWLGARPQQCAPGQLVRGRLPKSCLNGQILSL